jgi:DHA2 family methylenomycin A resistance protein-like MFS transporter
MTALTFLVTPLTPRAAARFGPRGPMAVGQFLMAFGLLGRCVAVTSAPTWLVSLMMLHVGLGGRWPVPP